MIKLAMTLLLMNGTLMQKRSDLLKFLDAIKSVEGWTEDAGIGKHGEVGPYQITPDFFTDAMQQLEFEKRDTSHIKFRDLEKDEALCRRIILAYFRRYCPVLLKNDEFKDMSRIFHRGPNAIKNNKGIAYWKLVRKEMLQ